MVKFINLSMMYADNSGLHVNNGLRFWVTNPIQDSSFSNRRLSQRILYSIVVIFERDILKCMVFYGKLFKY